MNDKQALQAIKNTIDLRRQGYGTETECISIIVDIMENRWHSSETMATLPAPPIVEFPLLHTINEACKKLGM